MSATPPSPYRVLGVTPSASAEEIRSAYGRALKDRRHPRADVVAAFNRLRDPARRLAQDLREPDPDSVLLRTADRIAAVASAPLVDDESTPLPRPASLTDPDAPGWRPAPRPVPAPADGFRSADLLALPAAAELPIPDLDL